ncbi:uncharacterized protein L201_001190 [Kwoniella dendrophila CBS 6074]|uniref:BZIP domain-containing protein n=1 Tax=Kwoniella dendrophila CBS 6074 TaxID=1295534 RepID=A0AAX4JLK5_9TREE
MAYLPASSPSSSNTPTAPSDADSQASTAHHNGAEEYEPPTYEESLYVINGSTRRPLSRKKRGKGNNGIGGDLVGSMKRGLAVDQRKKARNESRLKILLSIAAILFLILTTIWILRLNKRIKDKGGWITLVSGI